MDFLIVKAYVRHVHGDGLLKKRGTITENCSIVSWQDKRILSAGNGKDIFLTKDGTFILENITQPIKKDSIPSPPIASFAGLRKR